MKGLSEEKKRGLVFIGLEEVSVTMKEVRTVMDNGGGVGGGVIEEKVFFFF